jgi:hypothetical protein
LTSKNTVKTVTDNNNKEDSTYHDGKEKAITNPKASNVEPTKTATKPEKKKENPKKLQKKTPITTTNQDTSRSILPIPPWITCNLLEISAPISPNKVIDALQKSLDLVNQNIDKHSNTHTDAFKAFLTKTALFSQACFNGNLHKTITTTPNDHALLEKLHSQI